MSNEIKRVDPSENEFLAEQEKKSGKENRFFRTMANRPEVLKAFVPLYAAITGPGSLDNRIKELAYLAVSYANECPYCLTAHIASAQKAGIKKEEIEALQTDQDHGFPPNEKAAIAYARELTQTADGSDTRNALFEYFNDEQVVELTLVIAIANFTNRFNNGLEIEPSS